MAENNVQQEDSQAAQKDGRLRQAQLKMVSMLETVDHICQKHALDYWLEGGTLLGAVRHKGFIPWDDDLDISMPRASFEKFLQVAPQEIPETIWLQTPHTDPGYFSLCVPLKIRDLDSHVLVMHERGDEPYVKGIFVDIFVYDSMPSNKLKRKLAKIKANKILRLLTWKYTYIPFGHYSKFYKHMAKLFSKEFLDSKLKKTILRANQSNSPYMGYGYDCVNRNIVSHEDIYPLARTEFEGIKVNIAHRSEVILSQLYGDYMALPPEEERLMKHYRELIPSLSQTER